MAVSSIHLCSVDRSGKALTTGRYNEKLRLEERYLEVDIPALVKTATTAISQNADDCLSIRKLAEGRFNSSATFGSISRTGREYAYSAKLGIKK